MRQRDTAVKWVRMLGGFRAFEEWFGYIRHGWMPYRRQNGWQYICYELHVMWFQRGGSLPKNEQNIGLNFRIPRNSFTCVGRLWRSRHNTIDAILIQWHVNELRGILKLLRTSFYTFWDWYRYDPIGKFFNGVCAYGKVSRVSRII